MTLHTAVVIGAGQGMGQTAALRLARQGLTVYLVGRTESKLQATAEQIRAGGGTCHVFPADLTEDPALDALTAQLKAENVAVDVLVHTAGEAMIRPIAETSFADFNRTLAINLGTAILAVTKLIGFVRASANPSIILVSSKVALRGYGGVAAYSAAKAGVVGFARSLAVELREERIRVTALCPGPVDTPMRWSATPDFDRDLVISAETIADTIWYLANLPRGTMTGELLIQSEIYD
ncbi:MAG: SDR family oxidoreductase [Anaerolineae bacterium]|nr:SDR family oxidoreductase [Anaerolineae bacterium]